MAFASQQSEAMREEKAITLDAQLRCALIFCLASLRSALPCGATLAALTFTAAQGTVLLRNTF